MASVDNMSTTTTSTKQFGFRQKYSTTQALSITYKIQKAVDEGTYSCGIFLDFSKAFDTVNHNILITKLDHYGFRGIGKNWFCSYLSERKQFVSIGNAVSDYKKKNLLWSSTRISTWTTCFVYSILMIRIIPPTNLTSIYLLMTLTLCLCMISILALCHQPSPIILQLSINGTSTIQDLLLGLPILSLQ